MSAPAPPEPVMPRPRRRRPFVVEHVLAQLAAAIGDVPGAQEAIRSQLAALEGGSVSAPILDESAIAALLLVADRDRSDGKRVRPAELDEEDYATIHSAGLVAIHHKGGLMLTLRGIDVSRSYMGEAQ